MTALHAICIDCQLAGVPLVGVCRHVPAGPGSRGMFGVKLRLGMTWREYKAWVEDHGAKEPDPSRDPALR